MSTNMEAEFCVTAETRSFEVIRIVGNVEELGLWSVEKSIEMTRDPDG